MKKGRKRGVALISVLLILSIMLALTMGFVWFTMQDHMNSLAFHHGKVSFYLASAGQDYVLYLIKHNMLIYPSFPSSDNNANTYPRDEFDATVPGVQMRFFVGREEMIGEGANIQDSVNNYDDWTPSSSTNSPNNVIDATEGDFAAGYENLPANQYDANVIDSVAQDYGAGEIINAYDNTEEYLLISRLTTGTDSETGRWLDSWYACGTFRVIVTSESASGGSSNESALLIESTGMVKKVPTSVLSNDPRSWDVSDETRFPILARRTIMGRVHYYNTPQYNWGSAPPTSGMINGEYKLAPYIWFEKFQ